MSSVIVAMMRVEACSVVKQLGGVKVMADEEGGFGKFVVVNGPDVMVGVAVGEVLAQCFRSRDGAMGGGAS